jgi:acetolactate synthase regulatory subunit
MNTIAPPEGETQPNSLGEQQTWSIELNDTPDAIVRVLGVLRHRQCSPLSIDYVRTARCAPGHLVVSVCCVGGRPHRVNAWLCALVDVRSVHRVYDPAPSEPSSDDRPT